MRTKVYPVDSLLSLFNLVMSGIWMTAASWDYAPVLAAAHLAAAGLPWLLRRHAPTSRPVELLRHLYPLLWLLAFWVEVDLVRRQLHDGAHDVLILAVEQSLLGVHPHEIWMASMHPLWFSELLYFSYFAYYATLVVPVLWLVARPDRARLMDALFRMMMTFTICFLLFALMPVDGPRHFGGTTFHGPNARGFFARLVDVVADQHGASLGAAFPSSHVAGALTMAWIARLHLPRWAFRVLAVEAVGVFLATFYTQQHYAIDSLAGAALAVVVQALVVPAVLSRPGMHTRRIPAVPPLPAPVYGREQAP